jgi:hypothetical protein
MQQLLQLAELLLERVKIVFRLDHVHAAATAEEGAAHGARLVLLRGRMARRGRLLGEDAVNGHLRCVVYLYVLVVVGLVGEGHADGHSQEDEHRPGSHR